MSEDAAVMFKSHELLAIIEKTEENIAKQYNKERERLLGLTKRKRNWFASLFMASEWATIVYIDSVFKYKLDRLCKMRDMCLRGKELSISLDMFTWLTNNRKEKIGW